ncbi:hypothetical protein ACFV19_22535 [Streptomyces griseoluteus]|uniref:hypothetical protein n=1 Tax=Streptomyces griseoluteus TaxID=29306 RepID=UPI0036B1BF18
MKPAVDRSALLGLVVHLCRAEITERERVDRLLAAAPRGPVYDPDTEDVGRAELAADAAVAAARETEVTKPPGSRPAPMRSKRCASSARWSSPSPAPGSPALVLTGVSMNLAPPSVYTLLASQLPSAACGL